MVNILLEVCMTTKKNTLKKMRIVKENDALGILIQQKRLARLLMRCCWDLKDLDSECEVSAFLETAKRKCSNWPKFSPYYNRLRSKFKYHKLFETYKQQITPKGSKKVILADRLAQASQISQVTYQNDEIYRNRTLKDYFSAMKTSSPATRIPIPDPQCLTCTNFIYDGMKISQTAQPVFVINNLMDQFSLVSELKKAICAALNSGSGTIFLTNKDIETTSHGDSELFGAIYEQDSIPILEEQWRAFFLTYLKDCLYPFFKRNYPYPEAFKIIPEFVKVISNPSQSSQLEQSFQKQENQGKYILRIKVQNLSDEIFFQINNVKGFEKNFKTYLGSSKKIYELEGQIIYDYICHFKPFLSNFEDLKNNRHSTCFGENCFFMPKLKEEIEKYVKKIPQDKTLRSEDFSFMYKHNSLLILPTKKYNYLIPEFQKFFAENRNRCQIFQPFLAYRSQSERQIWVISHDESFIELHHIIKKVDETKRSSLISLTKNLQIHLSFSENMDFWFNFKSLVEKKFDEEKIQPKNQQILTKSTNEMILGTKISFSSLKSCLFSFIYLENLKIKSQFTMEQTLYKKSVGQI